jgi:hypothetical protein
MERAFSSLASALTVVSLTGAAVAVTNPAQAFSISLSPMFGSTENTGATAMLNFNFLQEGANVKLNLGIKNTTDGTVGLKATAATLVGVGFDLPTGISTYLFNAGSSSFTSLYKNASLNPYGTFDVGIRSASPGNFAGGNPTQGLTAGQSTLVSFLFQGNNLTAKSVEAAFKDGFTSKALSVVGRFQQVNGGGSDKVLGGILEPSNNAAAVPEPTTMLGAIAAAGAVLGRKRFNRKTNG